MCVCARTRIYETLYRWWCCCSLQQKDKTVYQSITAACLLSYVNNKKFHVLNRNTHSRVYIYIIYLHSFLFFSLLFVLRLFYINARKNSRIISFLLFSFCKDKKKRQILSFICLILSFAD